MFFACLCIFLPDARAARRLGRVGAAAEGGLHQIPLDSVGNSASIRASFRRGLQKCKFCQKVARIEAEFPTESSGIKRILVGWFRDSRRGSSTDWYVCALVPKSAHWAHHNDFLSKNGVFRIGLLLLHIFREK